jgi:hypothetical protein
MCAFATSPSTSGLRNGRRSASLSTLWRPGTCDGSVGRRNQYSVEREAKMRHPAQVHQEIGDLLDLLGTVDSSDRLRG